MSFKLSYCKFFVNSAKMAEILRYGVKHYPINQQFKTFKTKHHQIESQIMTQILIAFL